MKNFKIALLPLLFFVAQSSVYSQQGDLPPGAEPPAPETQAQQDQQKPARNYIRENNKRLYGHYGRRRTIKDSDDDEWEGDNGEHKYGNNDYYDDNDFENDVYARHNINRKRENDDATNPQDCLGDNTPLDIREKKVPCIENFGRVTLSGVRVEGPSSITGQFSAENVKMEKVKVIGDTLIGGDTNTINGVFHNIGFLKALNTTFVKSILVYGPRVELINSLTKNIVIRKSEAYGQPSDGESVYLDNTIVDGDIYFESLIGQVFMSNNSIVKGRITGASRINL